MALSSALRPWGLVDFQHQCQTKTSGEVTRHGITAGRCIQAGQGHAAVEKAAGKCCGNKLPRQIIAASSASERRGSTDFSQAPAVHFVGIGGAGLSALALIAMRQGWRVSGSDVADSSTLHMLRAAGAQVYIGHAASQLEQGEGSQGLPDALVVSSAVAPGNEEVEAAKALGIKVYKRGEWLGEITKGKEVIAVAGSHGKSTTTAMLALALRSLGDDVTAVVGAAVPQLPEGRNAVVGESPLFVLEADEYDNCFLGVEPELAVVLNVEWEHVDIFPTEAAVREVFRQFVKRIRPGGTLVVCGDSTGSKALARVFEEPSPDSQEGSGRASWLDRVDSRQTVTYGLAEGNDWQATMLVPNPQGGTDYVVVHQGRPMARVNLRLPGAHLVLNSLAVVVTAALLASRGLEAGDGTARLAAMKRTAEKVAQTLGEFAGVTRRFELVGRARGCVVVDDYAHHPTEVRATLQAARQRFNQQPLWVVFQPHTYSRLARLLPDFAPAFSAADRVIVTEVYAAREENVWGVGSADLVAQIAGPPAIYVASQDEVLSRLSWEIAAYETNKVSSTGDIVVLTLGAGDITHLGRRLLEKLSDVPA